MYDLTKRVVLGTVQLGLPYGRRKNAQVMSEAAAFEILDAAWEIGVRAFDTAEAYGSSASRVRKWIEARGYAAGIQVITKCIVDGPDRSTETLRENADAAIGRFDGIGRLTLLTHGAVGGDDWQSVIDARGSRPVALGQSVYSADEVVAACSLPDIDRLQVPGNVLDHRAINARGDSPVRLDVRSVYLQGLLLENPEQAEARVPGSSGLVNQLRSAALEAGASIGPLLIAAVLHEIRDDDRLVIGVDSPGEIEPVVEAFAIRPGVVEHFLRLVSAVSQDPAFQLILDPRRWPR